MTTLRLVRLWLVFFILAVLASGITAFPLEFELRMASDVLHSSFVPDLLPDFMVWIDRVRDGVIETNAAYPFMAYGTDWLAFAHIVIAIAYVGALRDPVRNIWIVQWGMICCVLVIPLALVAGTIRAIPLGWQVFDISFGVFGIIPLLIVYRLIRRLERESASPAEAAES